MVLDIIFVVIIVIVEVSHEGGVLTALELSPALLDVKLTSDDACGWIAEIAGFCGEVAILWHRLCETGGACAIGGDMAQ